MLFQVADRLATSTENHWVAIAKFVPMMLVDTSIRIVQRFLKVEIGLCRGCLFKQRSNASYHVRRMARRTESDRAQACMCACLAMRHCRQA
jgi:uncharacterized membrane protein (DUF4010 family)